MSELIMKKEIRSFIRNAGCEVNIKMICPIVKIINMKHNHVNNSRVRALANEIISGQVV